MDKDGETFLHQNRSVIRSLKSKDIAFNHEFFFFLTTNQLQFEFHCITVPLQSDRSWSHIGHNFKTNFNLNSKILCYTFHTLRYGFMASFNLHIRNSQERYHNENLYLITQFLNFVTI